MTSDDQPTTPVGLRPETAVICAGHSDLLSGITIAHDQALAERIRHRRGLSGATPGSQGAWARSGAWPPRAQTGKARYLSALQ